MFQKAQRSFVSIALNEKDAKTDFPKLLDILLSNDYQTPKNSIKPLRGLLGGWTWWRSWKQRSDTNTSSSDYYKSASAEEEKVVLVAPSRREDASFVEDSHSKKYFEAIHNCLDGMMAEIDRSSIGTQIAAQLITIVNSLLYTHLVKVLSESEIGQEFAEIEALQLAVKTEESLGRSDALRGTYLMILTRRNMLLVTAAVAGVGKPEESQKVEEQDIEEKEIEEKEIENVDENENEKKNVGEMSIKKEKTVDHQTSSENDIEKENTLSESTTSEEHRSKNTENESLESPEEKDPTDSSEITTETTSENANQDPTDPSDTNKATSPFMESTDIIPSQQSISLEEEEEEGEMDAEEDSLDVDEQREMEIVSRIVESLERFGSCSVDEAKEIDWNHCESYVVKGVIPLQEVQNVNILVSEENGDSAATSPQIIHIRYGSNGEIYLQVDYAIFVVNEIMNRIGTFLSCVCFICSVVCVC